MRGHHWLAVLALLFVVVGLVWAIATIVKIVLWCFAFVLIVIWGIVHAARRP